MSAMRVIPKLCTVLAATALTACASAGGPAGARLARHDGPGAVDHQKMALVDHIARRKGVQVVWVNPPQKDQR